MKAKRILATAAALPAATLLSGCMMSLTNLTSETVPSNPSGIYTLSVEAKPASDAVEPRTVQPKVVIDGTKHRMQPSDVGEHVYDYDYDMPDDRSRAKYYYLVDYRLKTMKAEGSKARQTTSDVHTLNVIDRFPITLEAERAPAGTPLSVLGKGFSRDDRVVVGEKQANTRFVSSQQLEFIVPSLQPGSDYPVKIRGGGTIENAGSLRVDEGTPLSVVPQDIELAPGEKKAIVFALDHPAPEGGLTLEVTTDVPESVIMPEVEIPGGSRSVSVSVEGGEPGAGKLYVGGDNMPETEVPITVQSSDSSGS